MLIPETNLGHLVKLDGNYLPFNFPLTWLGDPFQELGHDYILGAFKSSTTAGVFAKIVTIQKDVHPKGSMSWAPRAPNPIIAKIVTDDKAASCTIV